MNRTVKPETVTLPISEGDWLLVKKRLNAGEQRAMFRRLYLAGADGKLHVNPATVGLATVSAYLLDWSVTDHTGAKLEIFREPVEVVEAALELLDPESFEEIKATIEAHEERQALARAEEKKLRAGAMTSPAILPLPAAAAGAMSGSETSTPTST